MDAEPKSFHEFDPANDLAKSRVDLIDLHSLAVTAGAEVRLDPA